MVVVYVATHGSSRDVDTADVNYIITHDTEIGPGQNPDPMRYATALPMVDISNAIATRVKARRAAIFLDTCYSGNAASKNVKLIAPGIANSSPSAATLDHIKQGAGRMVFAASGTEEESLESDALKHGLFTYYLVEALRTQGGSMPLSRIFDYTQKHVSGLAVHRVPAVSFAAEPSDEPQRRRHRLRAGAGGRRVGRRCPISDNLQSDSPQQETPKQPETTSPLMGKLRHFWPVIPLGLILIALMFEDLDVMGWSPFGADQCGVRELDEGGLSAKLYNPLAQWGIRHTGGPAGGDRLHRFDDQLQNCYRTHARRECSLRTSSRT